jgi:hypothetical protein
MVQGDRKVKKESLPNLAGNDHRDQSRFMPIISLWGK